MSTPGLITIPCHHPVKEAMDRLEHNLKENGVTIFARIDHAGGAASAGMTLRPTELLIFGNPKAGTPLMQASQTMGIDLPLKILAWEDAEGKIWLSYNDVGWITERHGVKGAPAISALSGAIAKIAKAASG